MSGLQAVEGNDKWFPQIDTLRSPTAPFPATWLDSYEWLYVGTQANISQAQTPNGQKKSNQGKLFQLTLTLQYVGARSWDVNFYGEAGQEGDIEKRWTLGKM